MTTTTQELIDWCERQSEMAKKEECPKAAMQLDVIAQRMRGLDKPDCVWKEYEDGGFETQCGNFFEFNECGIKENDCKFCQYCGGAVVSGGLANE